MNVKKESRSDIAVSERDKETRAEYATTVISENDSTTEFHKCKGFIESLLKAGEENAIKGRDLQQVAEIETVRELRQAVEDERFLNAVILTSNKGYFLPETDSKGILTKQGYEDTAQWYRTMRRKGITTLRNAKSAGKAMREYRKRNQISILEDGNDYD